MSHVKLNITCLWLGHTWKTQAISQSSLWKPLQSMAYFYIYSCGHCANTKRGECQYWHSDCNNQCVYTMPTKAKNVFSYIHYISQNTQAYCYVHSIVIISCTFVTLKPYVLRFRLQQNKLKLRFIACPRYPKRHRLQLKAWAYVWNLIVCVDAAI